MDLYGLTEESGKMNKKKVIYVIILIVFIYLIINGIAIYQYGYKDEKIKCDAVIVLGASTDLNGVSPVYRERINHGIFLYNNGYADYIILTGGKGKGNDFSDAQKAKEYALLKGIPEDAILIEEKSRITEENLKFSKEILDSYNLDTCIIISDPLHMKRAMLMAKDYGINAYSSPTTTTMYQSFKTKIPFLLREEFFYIGYKVLRYFYVN